MSKSYRVRTEVGKDQNVTFELKQDFDLLEILSLSLTQSDVYTRMCSDFGVVVGRVFANGGYGIPNAKVCIFIPLDEIDEKNEVISQLYPYKQSFDKDGDGKRFNLLSSESNHDCHLAVGTFPTVSSVLQQQEVRYVFEKYYKYTAKTNEAGDFMIYGIPTGVQTIIMDVDLSDMGCFSMLPEDFKQKGYPESDFDGPRFKDDDAIDALPQILNQQKSIDVKPFWGDEEICQGAITRVDFDLANSGFKLEPTSVFMGSTATDTDKDSVNLNCRPKKHMGELCSLISKPGIIDCVRYTPFFKEDPLAYNGVGGTVPVLERYYLQDGGRVIDQFGAFLTHIPMNLDYLTTDEFGNLVTSASPSVGVPTRARCRFRIRPEQAGGSARLRRIGSYLVPNIREFNTATNGGWNGASMQSYTFSIEYHDYHPYAQLNLIPGAQDFFYDMTFNRVYSPAQHHDHVKHWGRRQFIGIKEILPEQAQQCSTTAMFFPINSAVRNNNFWIILYSMFISIMSFLYGFLSMLVAAIAFILGLLMMIVILVIMAICLLLCALNSLLNAFPNWIISNNLLVPFIKRLGCGNFCLSCNGCGAECDYLGLPLGFVLFNLKQTKYPECEKCNCRASASGDLDTLANNWPCDGMPVVSMSSFNGNPCSCIPNCNNGGTFLGLGVWEGHICCGETDDVEICCDNSYGASDDGIPGNMDDAMGGGCYVKIICINPTCLATNMSMKVFHEWGRREKMAQALCNGLMNYIWENNWVTGFLYQFQFNAKLRYNVTNDDYVTDSQYCKKTVYLHPTENVFYYRSTPFDVVTPSTGIFIGDDEGVYAPWWNSNFWGGSGGVGNPDHAEGDMDKHIYWPTTITDLGSRNQCVQQVCLDPKFAEECAVTDQIGSTTFQDITELVSDIYNMKMDREMAVIATMFPRPHKEIGGDVAQALMQNCMLGVYGYEATMGMTQCECASVVNTATTSGLTYPPTNDENNTGVIVPHAVNAIDASYHIGWTPFVFTSTTASMMTGYELIQCLTIDLSASTQEVPYYLWNMQGASTAPWGSEYNDWSMTLGIYQTGIGVSPAGWIVNSDGGGGPINGLFANGQILGGRFQDDMGNSLTTSPGSGLVHPGNYPLLDQNSLSTTVFSQPLFYYFGLRPGRTAYNMFLRLYVDEELADTVV